MIQGFKKFISRGNVMDLAIGVIIGAAFSAVVTSLTQKIIMPLIAAIFGQPNFDGRFVWHVGSGHIAFGDFITAVVNFLIIAVSLYVFIVYPLNKLRERNAEPEKEEEIPAEIALLTEIRDEIRAQREHPAKDDTHVQ
ncbi:large conductance mechanosensitive channel protein MscL [Actinotignum urinale]|uniref:large conductance mechanosensitive channel protein MscL n=1 Tax=Actinotignum urinale TaxID=190146 RepID=UPI0003B67F78|nr:large conductance mechanosensitive channel protein MscL [Actinotignum urinale]MDY5152231.1 large conductance mechanosensitive channel protein MscL [Actinotignum urinale]MDY5159617.1 large conductance mechanosensitive channel protein MscL [Actinotignum urinale]